MNNPQQDTICALASAAGSGAISLIRISGPDSYTVVQKIFKGKNLAQQAGNTIHFGQIIDQDQVIDEVLVSVFKSPKSYTGEDLLEISCHGSPYIRKKIIQLLIQHGCKAASAGEFTFRAFINRKINLSQAEAIADLIAAETQAQHKIAMDQMRGGFQVDLKQIREKLIHLAALLELELDFSEEDVEFASRHELENQLMQLQKHLLTLKDSFIQGNAIKEGVYTVIAGKPNAGKSTLLNALLQEERAIVSPIAGTTRDTIEDILTIEGIAFRLVDTAGLRKETTDEIEKIGIERSLQSIEKASVLLYVFDLSDFNMNELNNEITPYQKKINNILLIGSKLDIIESKEAIRIAQEIVKAFPQVNFCMVSSKQEDSYQHVTHYLKNLTQHLSSHANQVLISNTRHVEALAGCLTSINTCLQGIHNHISTDLIAADLRLAIRHIGFITGEVDVDHDILGAVFSKFCIGK